MNERQMQFGVGVVVFATMIIGGLLVSLNGPLSMGWLPWGQSKYVVGIKVPQAPGVDTHTPVRKNGVLIGRVKSIDDQDVGVLVQAEIYGKPLYAEYEPHVRTTVLGDATIDFVSRQPRPGTQPVADGAVFNGQVDPNPFDSLTQLGDLTEEFAKASRSIGQAGDEFGKLAKRINEALGDDTGQGQGRVGRLFDTTEQALDQFAQTMTSINEIIGDVPTAAQPAGQPPGTQLQPGTPAPTDGPHLRRKLRQSMNELPDAIHDFRAMMQDTRLAVQSAQKNFSNLEGFTAALGQKGDVFAESLLRVLERLDKLVTDFNELGQALNSREGSIGKLIHDPQFYNNLNTLTYNINRVVLQVHEIGLWLEPIIKDVRVFTDKIAREPGRIVTGGLNPSTVK